MPLRRLGPRVGRRLLGVAHRRLDPFGRLRLELGPEDFECPVRVTPGRLELCSRLRLDGCELRRMLRLGLAQCVDVSRKILLERTAPGVGVFELGADRSECRLVLLLYLGRRAGRRVPCLAHRRLDPFGRLRLELGPEYCECACRVAPGRLELLGCLGLDGRELGRMLGLGVAYCVDMSRDLLFKHATLRVGSFELGADRCQFAPPPAG